MTALRRWWHLRRPARITPAPVDLPTNILRGALCPTCWVSPGAKHELSCPEVSYEQFQAFLGGAR